MLVTANDSPNVSRTAVLLNAAVVTTTPKSAIEGSLAVCNRNHFPKPLISHTQGSEIIFVCTTNAPCVILGDISITRNWVSLSATRFLRHGLG